MAENRLFHSHEVDWLTTSRRWRIITAARPRPDLSENREHRRWMLRHSHRHPHAELLFIFEGQSQIGLEGQIHWLRPRSLCFFAPLDLHDDGYRAGSLLRHLWITVLGDHYIARMLERRDRHRYRQVWCEVISVDQAAVAPKVFSLHGENLRPSTDTLRAAARLLIDSVIQRGWADASADSGDLFRREVIAATCSHVEKTAGKGVSLAGLARIAGYSKFHFLRLFRRHTGFTVQQYIDRCRLKRTEELAAQGKSQKAIAAALGFSHPTAFSRWKRAVSGR